MEASYNVYQHKLPPRGGFNAFKRVHVRVAKKNSRPSRLADSVIHTCRIELRLDGSNTLHTHAEMSISSAMSRPSIAWVRVGELHQVNHFCADPQPGSRIREFVVGAIRVDREAEGFAVELQRELEIANN